MPGRQSLEREQPRISGPWLGWEQEQEITETVTFTSFQSLAFNSYEYN